jgi:hypothetical protein
MSNTFTTVEQDDTVEVQMDPRGGRTVELEMEVRIRFGRGVSIYMPREKAAELHTALSEALAAEPDQDGA